MNITICEWLFEFFLPQFYADLKLNGFTNLTAFIVSLNNNNYSKNISNINQNNSNCSNNCENYSLLLTGLSKDISGYLAACNQFESNLVYAFWLLNLFKPLVITLTITLLLLPTIVVLFLYASSLFLFLSKHWNKLKVS